MSRRVGEGYIDTAAPEREPTHDLAHQVPGNNSDSADQFQDAASSGSSVEEESEGEPFQDDEDGSEIYDDGDAERLSRSGEEPDDEDWDVDDEDWELANGDFTKQYNRVRQQHAATSGTAPLPARNAPGVQQNASATAQKGSTSASGSGSGPKPKINNILASVGVATNPKLSAVKQEKDKSDRATQDQVLDARTRLVLAGLVNRNVIGKIERCVSTGKEANVYYALPGVAVKIYRTSILNFRSRANYIVGEQRFRGEYTSSKNPRKMIRVWAEKELRNLRRLVAGGVRAPKVHDCKENVLVMDFLGHGDDASPRLKDAEIDSELAKTLYNELIIAVRRMYQHCHLVHADLSEYNILLHEGHLWIIDVSQSVEHDHPKAFDFLRADLANVEDFFSRRGVACLGLRRAWEFTVTENIGLSHEEEANSNSDSDSAEVDKKLVGILEEWIKQPSNEVDDKVFMSSYIPRTLAEVYDPERDVDVLKRGDGDDLIYAGVTGLKLADASSSKTGTTTTAPAPASASASASASTRVQDESGGDVGKDERGEAVVDRKGEKAQEENSQQVKDRSDDVDEREGEVEGEDGDGEDGDGDGDEDGADDDKKSRGFRHEDRDAKKERKKAVKEENREKRKNKMPKAEKQRLMKKSQGHK
ncbi:Atypical/RIO/RIO1 protein kinase [Kwoniella heveanensis CBS 569]|nr:Atypical/RIO/RIO1 protein kinase [Kwoniella heveanensis CBS 569]